MCACVCTLAVSHLHPDDSLSFTRRLRSRRSTKQANSSDLFASEIAATLVALPSHPRDNAARPRDPSHFRLGDEMAQQQKWYVRGLRGYYNAP